MWVLAQRHVSSLFFSPSKLNYSLRPNFHLIDFLVHRNSISSFSFICRPWRLFLSSLFRLITDWISHHCQEMARMPSAGVISIPHSHRTPIPTPIQTSRSEHTHRFRRWRHSTARIHRPAWMIATWIGWRRSIGIRAARRIIATLRRSSRSALASTSTLPALQVSCSPPAVESLRTNPVFLADAFNRQFLPGMPYRIGDNTSPTHSPPIGITPSSTQPGAATTMAQNQPGYSLPVGLIRPQPQLPQSAAMAAMIACVANGQSNASQQTLLHHHLNQSHVQPSAQVSPLRIRVNSPTRINSTSSSQSSNDVVITTTSGGSPTMPGATQLPPTHQLLLNGGHLARMSQMSHLHRPFESSSPKPKEASWPPQEVIA